MAEDNANRLMLAYLCIANEPAASLVRKVQILDRFDLADSEIAKVCACSVQSVRDARLKAKKGSATKKAKPKRK